MERRRIWFSGRVQGVGFRFTARAIAERHPVSGWVRNEPDGRVQMEVQGEPAGLQRYLEALRAAMRGYIQGETCEVLPPSHDERGFEIRH